MSKKCIYAISSISFFVPGLLVVGGLHSLDFNLFLSVAEHSVLWMVFLVRLSTGFDFYIALCFVIMIAVICGLFFSCFVASVLLLLFEKNRDDAV
ncbi:MAG: hypothetical protein ACRDC6_27720 [Shewanella sp.]